MSYAVCWCCHNVVLPYVDRGVVEVDIKDKDSQLVSR